MDNPRITSDGVISLTDQLIGRIIRHGAQDAADNVTVIHQADCTLATYQQCLIVAGAALHPSQNRVNVRDLRCDISDVYDMNMRLLDLWDSFGAGGTDIYRALVLELVSNLANQN